MTNAEIIRTDEVLGILRQWESEGFEGGILTPAVLADKLQDCGYSDDHQLRRLRTRAMMSSQYIDMDEFQDALAGIPVTLTGYDWKHVFEFAGTPDPCPPDSGVSLEPVRREDVEEIVALSEGENDGAAWICVGRLKDKRYFFVTAWCDYTGWG